MTDRRMDYFGSFLDALNTPPDPAAVADQRSRDAWCRLYHEARGVQRRLEEENARLRAEVERLTPADPHVAALCTLLRDRSAAGLAKYGTDLTPLQWLQHMREELADAALYCGRLAVEIQGEPIHGR